MLWLEVKNNRQKPFLLCYVYRPPSATNNWTEIVEETLEKASCESKEILLLGDFNFNLLNKTASTDSWMQKTEQLNLFQLVQTPTRVTHSTETLIDHAYSNVPENIVSISVPCYSISDHYPVCITRKITNSFSRGPVHKFITYRDTKGFSEADFIQDLENQPWSVINIYDNVTDALDYFAKLFQTVLNKHASKKKRRVKRQTQPNWMNAEISNAIRTRDNYHKSKSTVQYRIWRNKVKDLIQKSKREFYTNSIHNNYSNPKQLWQNMHDVTNRTTNQQISFIHDDSDNPILDPEETANKFNSFFTSLHEKINNSNCSQTKDFSKLQDFVQGKIPNETEFTIPLVTTHFIQSQLQNLRVSKATGIDDLSAKYLKFAAPIISEPLAKILNLSIQTGNYPDALKKAKVTTIFKRGEKSDINNFRPISVLPIITGVFERHISKCLVSFLEQHGLIYEQQSGFRQRHSCLTSLTKITDTWLTALNNNETVGALFLDLTKAFDLVNHRILLQKLGLYKFSASTLSWFTSYISNRHQQVNISSKLSSSKEILAGVPQGSVLGPLLFIIYINDLPQHIKYCILELFADDATLYTSGPKVPSICSHLEADLKNFCEWCLDNDMILNVPKTKAIFITSKQKINKIMADPPTLEAAGEEIQVSDREKLLGVQIDSTLSWAHQVEATLKKCNSLLYLLNRIKQYL